MNNFFIVTKKKLFSHRQKSGRSFICAKAIKHSQDQIVVGLLENVKLLPRWNAEIKTCQNDLPTFINRELSVFVEYIYQFFNTGKLIYRDLYIGEKIKQFYDPALDPVELKKLCYRICDLDLHVFKDKLKDKLQPKDLIQVEFLLADIQEILLPESYLSLKILFISDCIYLDILSFLTPLLAADNIVIHPTFITTKISVIKQKEIVQALEKNRYDLVFFSPFSYEFNSDFNQLQSWKNSFLSNRNIEIIAEKAAIETKDCLRLMEGRTDARIYVHDSVNIPRRQSLFKRAIMYSLTRRLRKKGREFVNQHLLSAETIERENENSNFIVLKESSLLSSHSELQLGAYLNYSELQHPSFLGMALAEIYLDIIFVQVYLRQIKIIVCDLDDTLWDGIIGEGPVKHRVKKQILLKDLKNRGVLLAINSKNSPENVYWDNAVLNSNDFVFSHISWESKVLGFKRLKQALNIDYAHMIFIDDRSDERELVKKSCVGIVVLDSQSPGTWRKLEQFKKTICYNSAIDRTKLYQERTRRNQTVIVKDEDGVDHLTDLDIRMVIREAEPKDYRRITELVNRTNQFNCQSSRTTLSEVRKWGKSERSQILITEASDRFGKMGIVALAVSVQKEQRIQIPVFVLSCRVFGFGIEDALLNQIKIIAHKKGPNFSIEGYIKKNQRNQPCHDFYSNNGFLLQGEVWEFQGNIIGINKPWLTITDLT
ncbi:MAG: HAD-IIIC family phosphatase [Proteobacteria bacterium]|nr:HAD-IIIC family phosphatase [Pseudomonadota bacterium]